MKKLISAIVILAASGCWLTGTSAAENLSGNTLYETMHIKQMAKRNFTNNGMTKYVYVERKPEFVSSAAPKTTNCYKTSVPGNMVWNSMQRKRNKKKSPCDTSEIGAVHLDKNSKVHVLNIAVDDKTMGIQPIIIKKHKLSIAPVYVEGRAKRQLKKINIVVHQNGKLR